MIDANLIMKDTSVANGGVFIAFGSNTGDRIAFLCDALTGLTAGGFVIRKVSSLYETSPVDCVEGTGLFYNGVVGGDWDSDPESLLELCQSLEQQAGRPAVHSSRESRTLDLDLILFYDQRIHTKDLTVPHPRACKREFVLTPLAEIAPCVIFPDLQDSAVHLLDRIIHRENPRKITGWFKK